MIGIVLLKKRKRKWNSIQINFQGKNDSHSQLLVFGELNGPKQNFQLSQNVGQHIKTRRLQLSSIKDVNFLGYLVACIWVNQMIWTQSLRLQPIGFTHFSLLNFIHLYCMSTNQIWHLESTLLYHILSNHTKEQLDLLPS